MCPCTKSQTTCGNSWSGATRLSQGAIPQFSSQRFNFGNFLKLFLCLFGRHLSTPWALWPRTLRLATTTLPVPLVLRILVLWGPHKCCWFLKLLLFLSGLVFLRHEFKLCGVWWRKDCYALLRNSQGAFGPPKSWGRQGTLRNLFMETCSLIDGMVWMAMSPYQLYIAGWFDL